MSVSSESLSVVMDRPGQSEIDSVPGDSHFSVSPEAFRWFQHLCSPAFYDEDEEYREAFGRVRELLLEKIAADLESEPRDARAADDVNDEDSAENGDVDADDYKDCEDEVDEEKYEDCEDLDHSDGYEDCEDYDNEEIYEDCCEDGLRDAGDVVLDDYEVELYYPNGRAAQTELPFPPLLPPITIQTDFLPPRQPPIPLPPSPMMGSMSKHEYHEIDARPTPIALPRLHPIPLRFIRFDRFNAPYEPMLVSPFALPQLLPIPLRFLPSLNPSEDEDRMEEEARARADPDPFPNPLPRLRNIPPRSLDSPPLAHPFVRL